MIANEWRSVNANVRALEDRAIIVHFDPSNECVHEQAGEWCEDEEVHRFIGGYLSAVPAVSMRWYAKAQKLKVAGFQDWRTSLLQMMLSNRDLAILAGLLAERGLRTDKERVAAFLARTGKSRATYYRLKRQLRSRFGSGNPVDRVGGQT